MHLDGEAVRSCITADRRVDGQAVVTIEGLRPDGNHPVQKAWRDINVPQCGYCQAGQIMQAAALLKRDAEARPTPRSTTAMSGNICRCGTYPRIRAAIKRRRHRERT